MELKDIFKAESKSTWDVLNRGFGFYIPPYQRQYDWDEKHIERLFEDIGHGLMQLLVKETKDSITFIGTLIVINDMLPETIAPNISRSDLPNTILSVIDGQQRLTTILLINICLHDEITRRKVQIKEKNEPAFEWLCDEIIAVIPNLQETFEEDKRRSRGEKIYQWQPRMIRAYHDSWSCSEQEAKYNSPIAAFIHGYSRRIRDDDENIAKEPYIAADYINNENVLWKNYESIQALVSKVSEGEESLEIPDLKDIAKNVQFQEAILKEQFPENVRDILSKEGNDNFKELIRLVLFANFLMHKVGVTVVSAPGAYAFDMFESLNTTGEPLTVFETFRPKVIESERLDRYESSDSRKYMRPVEKYLDQFTEAQTRQKETENLLRPFALAESGKKYPSDPIDQRRYMRNQYENLPDIEEKRKFVQHLGHVAEFMSNAWKQEGRPFPDIIELGDRDDVLMCMDVLKRADHHITIGPLARFYSQVLLTPSGSRDAVVSELAEAIKAMTAFFALWRGSGRTTGPLADQYRDLMGKGFEKVGIESFRRYQKGREVPILTAEKLRRALRYALGKGRTLAITSKEDWVKLSAQRPVYADSQPLTRFLLFASVHDTVEDDKNLQLPTAGSPGALDMLIWNKWREDLTIEHVAPQEPDSEQNDWPKPLYEKPDLLNYLGNLTLLPSAENSSLNNKSWSKKKEMYYVLSGPTLEERKARLADARDRAVDLPESTENLLREGKYFRHLSTICNVEKWDEKFVQKRSRRLAKLVWKNIAAWLGFDDE